MSINFGAFVSSLRFMVEGWLGIFIVMGVIIACIHGLNKVADKIEEKAAEKDA
ncbi:MAG: oxaloacetate decarboxylase [Clostridiales bacterium]|nr:oxaloacetate decarboxylase [Clostridiales bacterium]